MKRGNALALAGVCAIAAAASRAWAPLKPKHGQRRGNPGEAADHAALRARIDGYRQAVSDLEQAKKSAETANDAKTRYLVAVSHEIRSPLNAIYGYSQLLERGGVVEAAEAGRVIRRSSEHLANLVEGLLEISRIESGLIRISRETVPFVPLVEQLTDMFRSQAAEKGIDLRFVADGRLPVRRGRKPAGRADDQHKAGYKASGAVRRVADACCPSCSSISIPRGNGSRSSLRQRLTIPRAATAARLDNSRPLVFYPRSCGRRRGGMLPQLSGRAHPW